MLKKLFVCFNYFPIELPAARLERKSFFELAKALAKKIGSGRRIKLP